jgi:uncharacterized protein (DUF1501 family)
MSNNDWWSCDGQGGPDRPIRKRTQAEAMVAGLSRRGVLVGLGMSALSWAVPRTALGQVAIGSDRDGNVLVSVFLRGGCDGLNTVVPHQEDEYHRARPTLALKAPNDRSAESSIRTLRLNDQFGLNPALAPLLPYYERGEMAVVHAVGSFDHTRSHFEAMKAMERGLPRPGDGQASGWLARHLESCPMANATPLRAVAFGSVMPDSLRGATHSIQIQSLSDFRLATDQEAEIRDRLGDLYAGHRDEMAQAGRETLQVLETLNRLDPASYQPANGAVYPDTGFGNGMKQVAFLVRADVGLQVACLDMGGWDTHVAQGTITGWLTRLLDELGKATAALAQDLGSNMKRVTVVVQTEFGRRLYENAGLGTDHGRGSMMFLLGGGVRGGKVYADWPGLKPDQLEGTGDLAVTTDYRNVLAEVLTRRTSATDLNTVFPGLRPQFPGIVV